jgi:NAD(P)-dependent dehydrogenase (short-subunit alcohol dehydrogenase family)
MNDREQKAQDQSGNQGEMKTPPPQEQSQQPGIEAKMTPRPEYAAPEYKAAGKLEGKVALITGGDSGIGRSVAVLYAKEGADVAIVYLNEDQDAEKTKSLVEQENRRCLLLRGDIADSAFCSDAVERTVRELGGLDILVNNAAVQYPQKNIEDISDDQLRHTFEVNIFAQFYMTKAAVKHMGEGGCIINTTSVTAYHGSPQLVDYSSTKGAIVAFTRSLSGMLVDRGIRVNAVAPGPIWTPLIPASFDADRVSKHGADTPMERMGQPDEVAPAYVFLASSDSSYFTGQVLHPNGGTIVNA